MAGASAGCVWGAIVAGKGVVVAVVIFAITGKGVVVAVVVFAIAGKGVVVIAGKGAVAGKVVVAVEKGFVFGVGGLAASAF
jgi:hypothetical protein